MSKIRIIKIVLVLILVACALAFVELAPEPSIVTIGGFFLLAVGAFLGTDIQKMVKETKLLPPGKFEPMRQWKYYVTALAFAVLTARVIMMDYWVAAGVFGGGLNVVIGTILAGLNQNKSASYDGKATTKPAENAVQSSEASTGA